MTAHQFKLQWGISVRAYPFYRFHLLRTLGKETVDKMDKQIKDMEEN